MSALKLPLSLGTTHGVGNVVVFAVIDADGTVVANCGSDGAERAAEFIRSCNVHEELVTALQGLYVRACMKHRATVDELNAAGAVLHACGAMPDAQAVLAKAGAT